MLCILVPAAVGCRCTLWGVHVWLGKLALQGRQAWWVCMVNYTSLYETDALVYAWAFSGVHWIVRVLWEIWKCNSRSYPCHLFLFPPSVAIHLFTESLSVFWKTLCWKLAVCE